MMELQAGASFDGSGLTALTKFTRLALQSLALGLAALLAIDAKVSAGAVFASSFIVGRALGPIDQLVGSWKPIIQARGAYQTLRDLFTESGEAPVLTRLPPPTGRLDIENLTVTDPNRRVILGGVGFSVAPGDMIAIIGPSGAGKSTLVRAIAGAVSPAAGVVRFDGADQRNWDPERLSEYVGFMPQESSLFAGTVKDNISRFNARIGADLTEVDDAAVAAAKAAGAHEMILRFPGGYDYMLGLGGRGLSAGQAQRIALARALYRDPAYVILDEPNANLDTEGDQQLVRTLEALKARGKTILVVAHRLSVLPVVDKLLVIQDGRLAMFGERDDVLRKIAPPPPPKKVAPVTFGKAKA
jgi:ATP-binding cassette subfamily C protein